MDLMIANCGNVELVNGEILSSPKDCRQAMAGGDTNAGSWLACADPLEHGLAEQDGEHGTVDELGLVLTGRR
jgi:hypothetical protein